MSKSHGKIFYSVRYAFMSNSLYGVTSHKLRHIFVNQNKASVMKAYTVLHERIHEVLFKLHLNGYQLQKLEGIHDLIDYFVSDFKRTWLELKNNGHGLGYLVHKCLNRYDNRGLRVKKFLSHKKQISLKDIEGFKETCEYFDKVGIKAKSKPKLESKGTKQIVLCPISEKKQERRLDE